MPLRRSTALLTAAFLVLGPYAGGAWAQPEPQPAFTISNPRISESSGLAASVRHSGIVYTHNDSGGAAKIFAIRPDGATAATLTLAGATARDWEGIAAGRDGAGEPALFVADIGDNLGGSWSSVTVYRISEPAKLRDQTVRATAFRLRYEDGPRNAEAILINPRTNRLYIASKGLSGSLYEAPARLRTDKVNVLRKVGDAPIFATDGAYAPDGRTFVIRTYSAAHVYSAPGKRLATVSLPAQRLGESITYAPDGRSLLAGSEGTNQPVWRVPLPPDARPAQTPEPSPAGSMAEGDDKERADPGEDAGTGFGLLVIAGLAAALIVAVVRRNSS